ncbi:cell division protein ZipA-like [Dermacentor albipictus]|uniref:cell division protein ZipA-like n=1 Tax=Dermacentor albipictus TaxID=60249 RepID=UPI0031FD610A
MDPRTWSAGRGVWLALLFDVTLANSVNIVRRLGVDHDYTWDDFNKTPEAKMGAIVFAILVVVALLFVCWCSCARRSREEEAQQPLVPSPRAPAAPGPAVRSYTQQPVPCAMASPVAPYPQPYYYQQQAPPYPQEAIYVGHNMAPYAEPPTVPTQRPSAPIVPSSIMPPPPPPTYIYPPQYAQ